MTRKLAYPESPVLTARLCPRHEETPHRRDAVGGSEQGESPAVIPIWLGHLLSPPPHLSSGSASVLLTTCSFPPSVCIPSCDKHHYSIPVFEVLWYQKQGSVISHNLPVGKWPVPERAVHHSRDLGDGSDSGIWARYYHLAFCFVSFSAQSNNIQLH